MTVAALASAGAGCAGKKARPEVAGKRLVIRNGKKFIWIRIFFLQHKKYSTRQADNNKNKVLP